MVAKKLDMPKMQVRAEFAPSTLDEKARTIELVWSTGARGLRSSWFDGKYYEELSLDPVHVRMGRLNNKAPLLAAHDAYGLSGVIGVVEKAWIENGEGRATVRFSKRVDAEQIFQDVKDGILANVSVGYRVYKYEKTEAADGTAPLWRAIDWEPCEISIVPIGFDDSAKVRKAEDGARETNECEIILSREDSLETKGEREMDEKENQEAVSGQTQGDLAKKESEAREAEKVRGIEIRKAVRMAKLDESFADELVEKGTSIDEARKLIIEKWATKGDKVEVRAQVRVEAGGQDEVETRREGMTDALLHRHDPKAFAISDKSREYRGMSLLRMAEEIIGRKARGMSRSEIAQRALSTSDFPIILGNVAGKTLRSAYQIQPRTFQPWVRQGTLPDYKEMSRIQLGDAPDLEDVKEDGEYHYGSIGEGAEKIQLVRKGKLIKITEETIVNDDLDAFSRLPSMMGSAAARAESKAVYDILINNPNMADTVALFASGHGNLAGSGTTIPNGLAAAKAAMRKQKTLDGNDPLDLIPAFLICGPDKEVESLQTLSALVVAAKSADVNVWANSMKPIIESRITGNLWFLAASPDQIDTIEIDYLEGMAGPQISTKEHFESDAVTLKIKHVFGTKAIDYRGLYRNPGA